MWSLHEDRKNNIANRWNTPIIGCPMFVLNKRLQNLKMKLRT